MFDIKISFFLQLQKCKKKTIKGRKLVRESALERRGIGKKIILPRGPYKKLLRGIVERSNNLIGQINRLFTQKSPDLMLTRDY